ncbi:MAG: hypothetical protein Q4E22_02020 [Coriobacteriia bacterium]|nr:hypothetical protein [Coriobacteriia bacterium]
MTDFKSEEYGVLQKLMDILFASRKRVDKVDLLLLGEVHDIHPDLMELINNIPPGSYDREKLANQINSAVSGRGWGMVYGTVE